MEILNNKLDKNIAEKLKQSITADDYLDVLQKELSFCVDIQESIKKGIIGNITDNLKYDLEKLLALNISKIKEEQNIAKNSIFNSEKPRVFDIIIYRNDYKFKLEIKKVNSKEAYSIGFLDRIKRTPSLLTVNNESYRTEDINSVALIYFHSRMTKAKSYISAHYKPHVDEYGYKNAWKYLEDKDWYDFFTYNGKGYTAKVNENIKEISFVYKTFPPRKTYHPYDRNDHDEGVDSLSIYYLEFSGDGGPFGYL